MTKSKSSKNKWKCMDDSGIGISNVYGVTIGNHCTLRKGHKGQHKCEVTLTW